MTQVTTQAAATRLVFICGSALRGQPDHQNLQAAQFIKEAQTQPLYRLHAAENGWHPAIYQIGEGGISIPGEIYEMTVEQFDHLVSNEPPHMYPAEVLLQAGDSATAFFYPQPLIEQYGWPDISGHGGWAAYKRSLTAVG
jgi:gamma-glutamylaminecyclotransferase